MTSARWPTATRSAHAIRADVVDALSIVEQLPPRLQRIAMLRALRLSYGDIAETTGDRPTRVGQLVARANLEIYEVIAERAHHETSPSPRAERLWELEHEQPDWLTAKIGRLPRASRRSVANSARRRAWRRAALALDDFGELVGPERLDESLASTSQEPALRGPFSTARRALDEFARASGPERGRSVGA
jgi:hypothetical protein